MIVKIKEDDGIWSFFEGDSIIHHRAKIGLEKIYNENTIYKYRPDTKFDGTYFGHHLSIYKSGKITQTVFTNRAVYLMNDNGKTIDKIN